MSPEDAASTLCDYFNLKAGAITVGIGKDAKYHRTTLIVYIHEDLALNVPATWHGYPVRSKHVGKPEPA
jgi:hypothetical protein